MYCVYSFNHYVLIDANMYKCVTQSWHLISWNTATKSKYIIKCQLTCLETFRVVGSRGKYLTITRTALYSEDCFPSFRGNKAEQGSVQLYRLTSRSCGISAADGQNYSEKLVGKLMSVVSRKRDVFATRLLSTANGSWEGTKLPALMNYL